ADNQSSAPVGALDRLSPALQRRLEELGGDPVRYHKPFIRLVIKSPPRDLRNRAGTPVFPECPIALDRGRDEGRLLISSSMAAAYEDATAYCRLIARVRPGAGILRTLLLRRIGSSLRAGLLTARKLRDGDDRSLLDEEDDGTDRHEAAGVSEEAIGLLSAA